jgi:hypothetical protein
VTPWCAPPTGPRHEQQGQAVPLGVRCAARYVVAAGGRGGRWEPVDAMTRKVKRKAVGKLRGRFFWGSVTPLHNSSIFDIYYKLRLTQQEKNQ